MSDQKLQLPSITSVALRNFSLYSRSPNLDLQLPSGAFCLAGANGLGKSTFLSAINFCLTGFVRDPGREYLGPDDLLKHHRFESLYTKSYFSGRIAEADRDLAEVQLGLVIGGASCEISRGVFDPDGLRYFRWEDHSGCVEYRAEGGEDPGEIERQFNSWVVKGVGLSKFSQFVFLQHYVFTFDESRHLLLWDRRALNDALALAVGGDPGRADSAAQLRREMSRADSLARNLGYHASNVRGRINLIESEVGSPVGSSSGGLSPEEVAAEHRAMDEDVKEKEKIVEGRRSALEDSDLTWARAAARHAALREEYQMAFAEHTGRTSRVELHPVVAVSLAETECGVCGSDAGAEEIRRRLEAHTCPLCGVKLESPASDLDLGRLREVDSALLEAHHELDSASQARVRAANELEVVSDRLKALRNKLADFERANERSLILHPESSDALRASLDRLAGELDDLMRQKKEKLRLRDEKRRELVKHQRVLEQQFAKAEEEFAPLFRDLAREFLGMDLYIAASASEAIGTFGLSLAVEVQGTRRREEYQLSESQRFFLDIALRMAIAQFLARSGVRATLYVDTPEGSLDIAYEARAGAMFAKFVAAGHNLLLTANINTSQLLIRMAERCGERDMTVHRMTSWAELSDVQLSEEALFRQAFNEIEKALGGEA